MSTLETIEALYVVRNAYKVARLSYFVENIINKKSYEPARAILRTFKTSLVPINHKMHSFIRFPILIRYCSSVKALLSPQQSTLWHSALDFSLFVSICVPPNNPITACGATSFPGYHSFPKWAISACLLRCSRLMSGLFCLFIQVTVIWNQSAS